MKQYPKTYEDSYTSQKSLQACKIWKVSTDIGMDKDEYIKLFRDTLFKFNDELFDSLIKVIWLVRRFCYDGRHRNRKNKNGWILDRS